MAAAAIAALALPASAPADLVVSQAATPRPVAKGELVTIRASRRDAHALTRTVTFELCG